MQRSLFSGVSGLMNHQSILDVTANNLANVSTPGFKSSRISFATAMNQTTSTGSAPGGQTGGTNPRQVGLGVMSGSVDVDVRQGALLSTGRVLDLAVQGNGYFKMTRVDPQDGTFYSRVGNFGFDQNDDLVDLATGLRVNGIQDGVQGAISLAQYRSINATATREVSFQGNLSANTGALRGSELAAVLPLSTVSPDRTSFAPANEGNLLRELSIFRGTAADPGLALTGVNSIAGPLGAPANLLGTTTVDTGGVMNTQVTLPAGDFSGGNGLRLSIQRAGVVIGETLVTADLTGASSASRTVTLTSSVPVNPGDEISIVASGETTVTDPPPLAADGDYSFSSSMLTSLTIFGTKPDGEVYGGKVEIDPWKDTVSTLVTRINQVLTNGTRTFGSVELRNGNLVARATESGQSFSLFIGEDDVLPLSVPEPMSAALTGLTDSGVAHPGSGSTLLAGPVNAGGDGALRPTFTMPPEDLTAQSGRSATITVRINGAIAGSVSVPAADYGTANRVFTLSSFPQVKSTDQVTYEVTGDLDTFDSIAFSSVVGRLSEDGTGATGYAYRGAAASNIAAVSMTSGGLLSPTFTMPPVDLSGQIGRTMKVSVKVNGSERGAVTVPAANYTGGANRTFSLPNMPYVRPGDTVSFDLSGTLDLGDTDLLTWSTSMVKDNDPSSILQDSDGNGRADMFEDDPIDPTATDVNRWQYSVPNNTNFDWYKVRFAPETVASTIDVYDTNGTKHTIEARFFKTGSRVDADTGARTNVWDMIASINPTEGTLQGDLVTGIQLDSFGRYVGDATLGTTARGIGLEATGFRGQPDNSRLEVVWDASGPTTLQMSFGDTNSTNGLTGFGSSSNAAAVGQDGFANGSLDTLVVQANGEIRGLYSNGQSQEIAELQVFTFRNPAGLSASGNNLWQVSSNSGQETATPPGQGGAGSIASGSLEGSNVDIASEFTRLITAQRGFQVNARVIQTTDQILQELAGLIR